MIKQIFTMLIALMLCVIPCIADAPHDCDVVKDGVIDYKDVGTLAAVYGQSFDYWHPCDFNRDFIVDYIDSGIISSIYGNTLSEEIEGIYLNTIYIETQPVIKVNSNNFMNWQVNWNQVDKHKTSPGYHCYQYAENTVESYLNDAGYRGTYMMTQTVMNHHLTVIFTGDNPLDRDQWILIEPKFDLIVNDFWTPECRDGYFTGYWYIAIGDKYLPGGAHPDWFIIFNNDLQYGTLTYA